MEPFFACLVFTNVELLTAYTPDNTPEVFKVFHAFLSNPIPSFLSHCRHTDSIDLVPQTHSSVLFHFILFLLPGMSLIYLMRSLKIQLFKKFRSFDIFTGQLTAWHIVSAQSMLNK